MNATEKAKILKANGYERSKTTNGDTVWWFEGMAIAEHSSNAESTQLAYVHWSNSLSLEEKLKLQKEEGINYFPYKAHISDPTPRKEALEASRLQAANDAAGQEAYEEVVEERKLGVEEKAKFLRSKGFSYESNSGFRGANQCTWYRGEERVTKTNFYSATDAAYDYLIANPIPQTTLMRQQITSLTERIAQLESEKAALENKVAFLAAHLGKIVNVSLDTTLPAVVMKTIAEFALEKKDGVLPDWTKPAPSQVASVALAKPKNPVATRCRVNWNNRGFSSGSYPVLGYSLEKQLYILDISTDSKRAMPKPVKMADCETVQ